MQGIVNERYYEIFGQNGALRKYKNARDVSLDRNKGIQEEYLRFEVVYEGFVGIKKLLENGLEGENLFYRGNSHEESVIGKLVVIYWWVYTMKQKASKGLG